MDVDDRVSPVTGIVSGERADLMSALNVATKRARQLDPLALDGADKPVA